MATGALTPPDEPVGPRSTGQADPLAARLQGALGDGYLVERQLGAGGFAVVYLVRDLSLKRKLAVKVLSPDVVTSKTALERFRREAETVAQLSHPHIVPLHFVGQKDDLVYLVMECVEGETLAARREREGRLSAEETTRILREVGSALAHAHRRGVIHRDIKPQNVLLERETGRSLVTDFGIARTAEASSLTASGMLVGTPAYLSPEQVSGSSSDHRADIYALGIMGYEMLTGQPPFTGPTPTAVLMKRLASPPPSLEKLRPDAPRPLIEVINGCLAQAPEERFQSAGEVVRALGGATPVSGGHPTAEIALRMRRARRRWAAYASAAAALVALALLGWAAAQRARREPDRRTPQSDREMVTVAGGTYTIGRNDGHAYSRPAHSVTIVSFAMDVDEVTVAQYRTFMAATRAPVPWTGEPDSTLPVTGVSWAEATAYCGWRHAGGRLPTEEEWEAAARGPRAFRYPWGDVWRPGAANTLSLGRGGPAPVGSYEAGIGALGLRDLIGNVWEWTSSLMVAYPGGAAPPRGDQYYVIRGGAFNTPDSIADATRRGYQPTTTRDRTDLSSTGFRCVAPLRRRR